MARKSAKTAETVAENSNAETIESGTEEIKAEKTDGSKVMKAEPQKSAAGKTGVKAAEKKPAKKTAAQQCSLHVQYAGKSYSEEELMKMAKEIWKRDLKRKVGDLNSISLYVKTEENKVYYVMNDEVTGSFDI